MKILKIIHYRKNITSFFSLLPKLNIQKNLLSVIIPVYNRNKYIKKIIKNILFDMQIPNMELIFVDDCSFDNSSKIIEQEQKNNNKIILIKNSKNLGMLTSRYIGFKNSKGKYIAFGDSDDLYYNNIFEYGVRVLQNNDIDYVYFKYYRYKNIKDIKKLKKLKLNFQIIYHGNNKKIFQNAIQSEYSCKEIVFGLKNNSLVKIHNDGFGWSVCGKIYRREILKKAYNYIGNTIINKFNIYAEDTILSYSINYLSRNVLGFSFIGYLININSERKSKKELKDYNYKLFLSLILFFNFIMRESKNKYVCKKINSILDCVVEFDGKKLNNSNFNLTKLLNKMSHSKCVNSKMFNNVLKLFNITYYKNT